MRRIFSAAAFAFVSVFVGVAFARAEQPDVSPNVTPLADPAAAVDSEYGHAVRQVLMQILLETTEASCRETQKLNSEVMSGRLRDILIIHGTMWNSHRWWTAFFPNFSTSFVKRAGNGSLTEWRQLLNDPEIRRLVAMQAPERNMELIDNVVEDMGRWMLLRRAPSNLVRRWGVDVPTSPILLQIQGRDTEMVAKNVSGFLQSDHALRGKRYMELSKVHSETLQEALKTGFIGLFSFREIYPDITVRLRTLCIPIND